MSIKKTNEDDYKTPIPVSNLTLDDQNVKYNINYLIKSFRNNAEKENLVNTLRISPEDMKNYVDLGAKIMPSEKLQAEIEEYFDLPNNLKLSDRELPDKYRLANNKFSYLCSDLPPMERIRIKQNIINLINNRACTKKGKNKIKKDLAGFCGVSENAISNYLDLTHGKVPERDNLIKIAKYFGETLDNLIYTDIPDEPLRDILVNKKETVERVFENLLPFIEYTDSIAENDKNEKFMQGIVMHEKLLNFVFDNAISDHLDEVKSLMLLYKEAAKEGAVEALANHLWWLMYFGIGLFSITNQMLFHQDELKKDDTKVSDVFRLGFLETPITDVKDITYDMESIQQDFLREYEELIIQDIHELAKAGYYKLASYYTAIRYIYGIMGDNYNDLTKELNHMVGYEMLRSLYLMGNEYAIDFYNIFKK